MIRIAIKLKQHPDFQVIVYGKDYEDIRKQIVKLEKDWVNRDKRKDHYTIITLDGRHPFD